MGQRLGALQVEMFSPGGPRTPVMIQQQGALQTDGVGFLHQIGTEHGDALGGAGLCGQGHDEPSF